MTTTQNSKKADIIIGYMLNSKKQSKAETAAFAKTKEFKEIVKRLKEKNSCK